MTPPTQSKRWRRLRRCLLAAAVALTLIAAFYTEELWRGKRAWENCKRELEAKGIKLDQKADILPPVPDDQNVFAVPEMREWFLGKGPTVMSVSVGDIADLYEPGDTNHPSSRVVVAEVAFSQPDSNSPAGFTVLSYEDPHAKAEVSKLIKDAVGPYFTDPWGFLHLVRRPEEIQPAKILLQCQTAPSAKELEQFLTTGFHPDGPVNLYEGENARIEPAGKSSYKVTMEVPGSAAELLARIAVLEPQFAVMRQAFQRPYARVLGDDQKPEPDLGLRLSRITHLARILSAQAQCHLFLGQPEEALRDLTLSQDLCRIGEDLPRSEWGMLATLIRETVMAIDLGVIAEGLRSHAWNDAQLAALQAQLKKINFVSDMKQVMLAVPAGVSDFYPNATAFNLGEIYFGGFLWPSNAWTSLKATVVGELIPRGWVYQNMVQLANDHVALGESSDSAGQQVFPKKVDAVAIMAKSHPSPYNYLARMRDPSFSKNCRNTARVETQVHEALIACALERYRLLHNEYPETLDALVPQFLAQVPHDLIGGRPLHYHRTADGTFILYSIGWSERDGGGVPGKTVEDGDWVWPNP
ncbi:MAG: hypothetical protein ABSA47_15330 [Verrucomicrobiota bacterium]|jgi:hypothetical protein